MQTSIALTPAAIGAPEPDDGRQDALPLAALLHRLLENAAEALDGDRDVARTLLNRAAALVQAERDRAEARVPPRAGGALALWQVRKVLAHIDENLGACISMRDLARLTRLSTCYFSRAFKARFGQTPHAFVIGRRVARAQVLMIECDEPLSQIALRCGFSDQAHFSRVFKRAIGATPNEWRRARRGEPGARLAASVH